MRFLPLVSENGGEKFVIMQERHRFKSRTTRSKVATYQSTNRANTRRIEDLSLI